MRFGLRFALSALAATAVLSAGEPAPPPARAAADSTTAVPAQTGEVWSLARCIQAALESNGDIRGAKARTVQARGGALGAWSNILPTISADATYSRVEPDKQSSIRITDVVTPGAPPDTTTYAGSADRITSRVLSASAQANLFHLSAWSQKKRQNQIRSSVEQSESETRNDVVYRVKQQYFECVKAVRLAEVARESERLARDEETRSEALFQVGSVARGDVLKARARRASTQLSRIQAENQVQIQNHRLRQLIGVSGGAIAVETSMEEAVTLPDSSNVVASALKFRPTIASAYASEKAARTGLFGARAARLPYVTGQVSVDRQKLKERQDLTGYGTYDEESPATTQWSGAVRLSLPIFDGLALEGNMRSAKGQLLEAEASRRQLELDVAVETQQAWLLLKEAVERIAVAREGVASAEEDHKFSKSRYELGAGTYLDLLNAEVSLEQARQQLVEAQADARVAEAALERAIGERRY
ncbi:MAG TPA: TolC family protein [Candidatus Eisenbacteria bacterium]|nr:TolC family protein [Candidatus Eisenbacteria bacterium]